MKIKNEAELLSAFCDNSYSNPLRSAPFFNTKYNEVLSTDGYVLIRIKPERLACEYPKGELTLPELEFPCKKKITIEAINEALDACPKVDEEVITQEAVECKECDGDGQVYWEYTDNHGHTHNRLYDCPICDGTCEIKPEIRRKTGKQITDDRAIIKVGNAYLYGKIVNVLKSAMSYLEASSAELLFNPERGINKVAIGDIHIGLGPMNFDKETCECNAELKLTEL